MEIFTLQRHTKGEGVPRDEAWAEIWSAGVKLQHKRKWHEESDENEEDWFLLHDWIKY